MNEAINHLLERLEAGIEREKRVTSYAAQVLRTLLMEFQKHVENAISLPDPQQREASLQALKEAVGRRLRR